MSTDYAACMDIGGTFIKYSLVDINGTVVGLKKKKTSKEGKEGLLAQVFDIIEEMLNSANGGNVIGIGISSAGQVNHWRGEVLSATDNLPGWVGIDLKSIIENKYNTTCQIDNDVKCAALGEMHFGAAKNVKDFVCITIGTGVGGAIVENGRLLRGNNGIAGEVGHMVIRKGGRKCNCGNYGCYEQYASVTALKATVAKKLRKTYLPYDTGVEWLFERYNEDERLRAVIDRYAEDIALGIVSLVSIANPSYVIIGGAVSSCELLMDKVTELAYERVMPVFKRSLKIVRALRGNEASLLGVSTYIFGY